MSSFGMSLVVSSLLFVLSCSETSTTPSPVGKKKVSKTEDAKSGGKAKGGNSSEDDSDDADESDDSEDESSDDEDTSDSPDETSGGTKNGGVGNGTDMGNTGEVGMKDPVVDPGTGTEKPAPTCDRAPR